MRASNCVFDMMKRLHQPFPAASGRFGLDVLRHRVAITYEAEAEEKTSETVIQKIFDELPVP